MAGFVKRWRRLLLALLLVVAATSPANADSVREAVAAALYAASATHAAEMRAADQRMQAERTRIEAVAARARAGEAQAREELAGLQERFVAELATRDLAYAREISVFRSAVQDIASTPEGAAALERFNTGDQSGALSILDELQRARSRAREAARGIEEAAEKRRIAQLALQALGRDGITAQSVLARFEDITTLDANVSGDWVALSQLYHLLGRIGDSLTAGERAVATAQNDDERLAALQQLAERQRLAWRSEAAGNTVVELVRALQAKVVAEPDNQALRLRYADSLLIAAGLTGGYTRESFLTMVEGNCRAIDDPALGEWATHTCARAALQRAESYLLSARRIEMGPATEAAFANVESAVARYPNSLRMQDRFGDAYEYRATWRGANGDYAGALADWTESLRLQRATVARDPTNVAMQHVLLSRLSAVAGRTRNNDAARAMLQEAFAIAERAPYEREDIEGLEQLSGVYTHASQLEFRTRNYEDAAAHELRQIQIDAGLQARFPTAPRSFTNFNANANRRADWYGVQDGPAIWRRTLNSLSAHIASQPSSADHDWRFPLVLVRAWSCTAYLTAGDNAAASQECDTAVQSATTLQSEFPTNQQARRALAYALAVRGDVENGRGDTEAAMESYTASIETIDTSSSRSGRAALYAARADWRLAIEDIDAVIRQRPGYASALTRSCRYRAIANTELDIAEQHCTESLRLSATREARLNLAMVRLRQGDFAAVIAEYDRVLTNAANNGEALYGRGLARHHLGQAAEGAADMSAGEAADADTVRRMRSWGFRP